MASDFVSSEEMKITSIYTVDRRWYCIFNNSNNNTNNSNKNKNNNNNRYTIIVIIIIIANFRIQKICTAIGNLSVLHFTVSNKFHVFEDCSKYKFG